LSIQNAQFTVSIAPNPTKGQVILNSNQNCTVTILDILGKVVYETRSQEAQNILDLSNLSKGMYMIKANNGNVIQTIKLLKE
jgi:DUF917 family protein